METELNPKSHENGPPALPRPAAGAFPPAAPVFRPALSNSRDDAWQLTLAGAATSALWIGCLTVGILGVLLPYAREHLQARTPPPIVDAVRLMPPRDPAPALAPPDAGPKPDTPPPPDAPPPIPVAAPSPAIAFAVPVEGPTQIVDARYAVPVSAPPAPRAPPVQHLTFGVGDGQQPDPEYPEDARLAGEQGTVVVRFTVGPDGTVQSAVVKQPSRWPLLNQAALRAVRYSWRLKPNKAGTYEIPIQFVLTGN